MPDHPSIYICLLCGWRGQPRELARDQDGTHLFCPGCDQEPRFLMDLSETPEEFMAIRNGSYIHALDAKRQELRLKPTDELRRILRKIDKVRSEEP